MQVGEVVIIFNRVNKLRVPVLVCTHVHRRCLTNVLTVQNPHKLHHSNIASPKLYIKGALTSVCYADMAVHRKAKKQKKTPALAGAKSFTS